jgi:DNA-binding winged helix-turn-helix (wHTH) protein
MPLDVARVYEFGKFRLEPGERQLRRDGRLVPLTPKAFDTLHALVAAGGRAVSKDDLMQAVWPDTNVAEATLAQNVFAVRKALGDSDSVETVPSSAIDSSHPCTSCRAPPDGSRWRHCHSTT